jgi:hypothetical protein
LPSAAMALGWKTRRVSGKRWPRSWRMHCLMQPWHRLGLLYLDPIHDDRCENPVCGKAEKADKVAAVFERIDGGKIRATTTSWGRREGAFAQPSARGGHGRGRSRWSGWTSRSLISTSTTPGLWKRVSAPKRDALHCNTGYPMETREILLKADKVSVVFERIEGGKIRVTTSTWDGAKVIWQNQGSRRRSSAMQVALVRVDKPIAYWTSTRPVFS